MSKSKYFGKSFTIREVQKEEWSEDRIRALYIGEHPGQEDFTPNPGEYFDQALLGLVDTLRVTRKLLAMCVCKLGVRITDPNEFHRDMIIGAAKKIGELPEDVLTIVGPLISELFQEMIAKRPKKN